MHDTVNSNHNTTRLKPKINSEGEESISQGATQYGNLWSGRIAEKSKKIIHHLFLNNPQWVWGLINKHQDTDSVGGITAVREGEEVHSGESAWDTEEFLMMKIIIIFMN